jgi:hypothetical protein
MAIEPDPMNPPSGWVKLQDRKQKEIHAAVDRIRKAGKATDPAGAEAALEHDVDVVLERLTRRAAA